MPCGTQRLPGTVDRRRRQREAVRERGTSRAVAADVLGDEPRRERHEGDAHQEAEVREHELELGEARSRVEERADGSGAALSDRSAIGCH